MRETELFVGVTWEGASAREVQKNKPVLIRKAGDVDDWGITLNLCVLVFSNGC